jgi:hypothetical protein
MVLVQLPVNPDPCYLKHWSFTLPFTYQDNLGLEPRVDHPKVPLLMKTSEVSC